MHLRHRRDSTSSSTKWQNKFDVNLEQWPHLNKLVQCYYTTDWAKDENKYGHYESIGPTSFHNQIIEVFQIDSIRKRAVAGLQILVRSSFCHFTRTARLRVMLIITLSELMSEVQVTQMKLDGTLEYSGEARRLLNSLEEMADEAKAPNMLKECGLPESALVAISETSSDNRWSWSEVKYLSASLLLALDASLEHALLVNSRVLSVCIAFLSGEPATRLRSQELYSN